MSINDAQSLSDEATFAGSKPKRPRDDLSLGDERTLGGGDAAGLDTIVDDIEVVDLESRYKVEGTLGQGGMGAVLLATDARLGRKVAIKRILGEAARSKTAIARFLTEAKAIAALNHPNIVQIYDYGRAKDGPFLIMELVDGGSLADLCRAGALPLDRAIDVVCQVCEGLPAAHAQGIVHRDIKPANILLNRAGAPKLTDFGLAKAEAADHGMTMTGAVMGTPDFMPPEQRRDAALVDHRSDLWSLAATFYQMLTCQSARITGQWSAPDPRPSSRSIRPTGVPAALPRKEACDGECAEDDDSRGDSFDAIGRTVLSGDRTTSGDSPGDGLSVHAARAGPDFKTGQRADFPSRESGGGGRF
jgi:serine/threonine protein kinase